MLMRTMNGAVTSDSAQRMTLHTGLLVLRDKERPYLFSIYGYFSRSSNTDSHLVAGYTGNYDFDIIAYNNTFVLFSGQYKHPAFLSFRFVQAVSLLSAFALQSLFYRNSLCRAVLRGGPAAFHRLGRDLVNFDC